MATEGRDTILFLDREKIFFYDGSKIFKLDLPPAVIKDVEVLDKSGFDSLLNDFIKLQKLAGSKLWIILAESVCFSKEIPITDLSKIEEATKEFLEAVPFDQLLYKSYKGTTGLRIISTNLELVESISEIFERNAFEFAGVVPGALFAGHNTKRALDAEYVKSIIANKNIMKQGNMLARISAAPTRQEETPEPVKKPNSMLPYLLIGFGVLLLILGLVLYSQFKN